MKGSPSITAILRFLTLAVALYLIAATAVDNEANFFLFLWRAFAPTTTHCVAVYIVIQFAVASVTNNRSTLRDRAVMIVVLVASALPIARRWHDYKPSSFPNTSSGYNITVLDMNLLGHRDITPVVFPEIERRQPDIVLLQEVTAEIAAKIQERLTASYPCQIIDPRPGSYGMATLSKYPCEKLDFVSQGYWVGRPQITRVILPDGRPIVAVNIHGVHPHALIDIGDEEGLVGKLNNTVSAREQSISEMINYVRGLPDTPIVIAGDLNSTMRNRVYSLIREAGYNDSWITTQTITDILFRGGTWPFPEHGIPSLAAWLLRIDFIFFSTHLSPLSTELLPGSLGSDHRGLVARFR